MTGGYVQLPYPLEGYAINQHGSVIELSSNIEIAHHIGPNSQYVGLTMRPSNEQRSVTMHLHRLLAIAFVVNNTGLPIDQLHVNHIDGNKLNNSICNLEWVTRSGNCDHAYRTGLRDDNVWIEVANFNRPMDDHMFFYSQAEAARFLGINPSSLHEYLNTERRWVKPIKGYFVSRCDDRSLDGSEDDEDLYRPM